MPDEVLVLPDVVDVVVLPEVVLVLLDVVLLDEVELLHLMCPQRQLWEWLGLFHVAMAGVVTAIDETMAAAISVLRIIRFPLASKANLPTEMVDANQRKQRAKPCNWPFVMVNRFARRIAM